MWHNIVRDPWFSGCKALLLTNLLHWFSNKLGLTRPSKILNNTLCCLNRCVISRLRRMAILHCFLYNASMLFIHHFYKMMIFQIPASPGWERAQKEWLNFWKDLKGHDCHLKTCRELPFANWTFPFCIAPEETSGDGKKYLAIASVQKQTDGKFLYTGECSFGGWMMQVQVGCTRLAYLTDDSKGPFPSTILKLSIT